VIVARVWYTVVLDSLNVFLCLERLVQAFRIAAARHHAAGEFIDDDHFAVLDDVSPCRA